MSSNFPDGVKIVSGRESGAASTEPLWNELSSSLCMYWWVLVWGFINLVVDKYWFYLTIWRVLVRFLLQMGLWTIPGTVFLFSVPYCLFVTSECG